MPFALIGLYHIPCSVWTVLSYRTSEVRERLNMVRRRCAEMTVLSSKESANRPSADHIRTWAQSLDLLLGDKCQFHICTASIMHKVT